MLLLLLLGALPLAVQAMPSVRAGMPAPPRNLGPGGGASSTTR